MGQKRKNAWKSLPMNVSEFDAADFKSFGGIEELTDYEIIRPTRKRSRSEITEKVCKKKTKKQSKKSVAVQIEDDKLQESVELEDTSEELDMSAWCNLFVPEEILSAIKDLGFLEPTEIQKLVLPAGIRDHKDILAAAETGSGKTLAFGIPLLTHIRNVKEREKTVTEESENKLKGLILAPTRELALQVKNHLQDVSKYLNVKIIAVVGGMSVEKQRRLLRKSPDIIVATPGRLWQLMEEGDPCLEQVPFVRYLVIDEADRMVEKGHFEELSKLLELMNENKSTKRRQNFVFSATLTMIHELPKRLELKKKQSVGQEDKLESLMQMIGVREKPKIFDITRKSAVVETLTESRIMCKLEEKDIYLYYFKMMYPGRTLVFCNSISSVRRLKSVFEQLDCSPLTLHASMHQRQRLKNLETFASSQNSLLLATDVASRGLDIKGIEHVVHFQVPRTAEIYVHRSGRTARAQNEGLSLMLIEPQEILFYKRICKTLNKDSSLPLFPVDQAILRVVKERVMLARQIDQLQHRQQRLAAQNRWFLKAAAEMEVDMDDEKLLNDLGDDREQALKSRQIKALKKQLQITLRKPISSKVQVGSYPTKSGKLLKSTYLGHRKAVEALKKNTTRASLRSKKKRK